MGLGPALCDPEGAAQGLAQTRGNSGLAPMGTPFKTPFDSWLGAEPHANTVPRAYTAQRPHRALTAHAPPFYPGRLEPLQKERRPAQRV